MDVISSPVDLQATEALLRLKGLDLRNAEMIELSSTLCSAFREADKVDRLMESKKQVGLLGFSPVPKREGAR